MYHHQIARALAEARVLDIQRTAAQHTVSTEFVQSTGHLEATPATAPPTTGTVARDPIAGRRSATQEVSPVHAITQAGVLDPYRYA